jgi:lysophospholipase L1-like esterase
MNAASRIVFFFMAALLAENAPSQTGFYLRDGDRVVFYGDSITDQRLYTTFAETFVLTRFPQMKVEFVHSGWGGDRVSGGGGGPIEVRLSRDVIVYRPTVVTIMLGMNDGRYRAFDQDTFDAFSSGYEKIVQMLRSALPSVRLTLIQPSPYDDVTRDPSFEGGYNSVLLRFGQFVKELAQGQGLEVADLNTSLEETLRKAKATDSVLAQRIVPDRVHPAAAGHLLMAAALLRAWNAPAIVSSVEVDASAGRVVKEENCSLTDLQAGASLSWTQIDRALPMPIDLKDPVTALALRSSDFVESLDLQPLKVTGLTRTEYTLVIDGDEVGVFSKEALREGINLATLPTAMARQAAEVHALTLKHNNIHFVRWRQVQVPLENDALVQEPLVLGALDSLESELLQRQRSAAQPKIHRYELRVRGD